MSILSYFPGGEAPAILPGFTYTGDYSLYDEGDGNWYIDFLTSGTLTFIDKNWVLDVWMAGGGGGAVYGGGGGGGYTRLEKNVTAVKNNAYTVVVGAGGVTIDTQNATDGGGSSFGALSVPGGAKSTVNNGGAGGSGGGGRAAGTGGSNGSNGQNSTEGNGGAGQGTTTRKFHEASGDLLCAGGGAVLGANGAGLTGPNSGLGGNYGDNNGQSGLVSIRNHRAA